MSVGVEILYMDPNGVQRTELPLIHAARNDGDCRKILSSTAQDIRWVEPTQLTQLMNHLPASKDHHDARGHHYHRPCPQIEPAQFRVELGGAGRTAQKV